MKTSAGFTMIETIAAIAIVAVLSLTGISSYRQWQSQQQLVQAKESLASALYRAQQLGTAAAMEKPWGIHLEANSFTLYASTTYDPLDPINKVWTLDQVEIVSPNTTFADGALRTPNVLFGKFTGETTNTGTISLMSMVDGKVQNISIEASGLINL